MTSTLFAFSNSYFLKSEHFMLTLTPGFRIFNLAARSIGIIILIFVTTGCGGATGSRQANEQTVVPPSATNQVEVDQLNEKLGLSTAQPSLSLKTYKIGVGDVLKVSVFQVPDLSGTYQVDAQGYIQIPLLDAQKVRGLRVDQVRSLLTDELAENLLKNPQVTISIEEYRSQQIAVMGGVARPDIYKISQGRNVYEMLSLAGGFSAEAGNDVYIKTTQPNKVTGALESVTMAVETKDLFDLLSLEAVETQQRLKRLILGDGDSIFVSKAGVVYIDGPISRPGKYSLSGGLTVTQLLAIAGGGTFVATDSKVRVLRKEGTEVKVHEVNVKSIRANKKDDFALQGGDIVTIGKSAFKTAYKGFFEYFLRVFLLF